MCILVLKGRVCLFFFVLSLYFSVFDSFFRLFKYILEYKVHLMLVFLTHLVHSFLHAVCLFVYYSVLSYKFCLLVLQRFIKNYYYNFGLLYFYCISNKGSYFHFYKFKSKLKKIVCS